MTQMLFASNNISHWPGADSGSIVGTYDSDRVPYSITLSNYEILNSPSFIPTTGDDTWFHFRLHRKTDVDSARGDTLLQGYDVNSNLLFNVSKKTNTSEMYPKLTLYDGATSVTVNSTLKFTLNKTNSIDVHYISTALGLEVRLYVNSALGATVIMGANTNSYSAPSSFSIGTGFTDVLSDTIAISEILVADSDTRNARLDLLRPVAGGAYGQWSGSLVDLADDDSTTGMTTVDPDLRQSVSLSTYTGASNISNFMIVSQTTRGQNSPTQLQHSIRLSGVDYDSANIAIPFVLQYNLTDYAINPATTLPWEGVDLSLIETGFKSIA